MSRHRGDIGGGFEIGGRDRHREVDSTAALHRAVHRVQIEQVAFDDFGAERLEVLRALVAPAHHGAHRMAALDEHLHDARADRADLAGCTGNEDG